MCGYSVPKSFHKIENKEGDESNLSYYRDRNVLSFKITKKVPLTSIIINTISKVKIKGWVLRFVTKILFLTQNRSEISVKSKVKILIQYYLTRPI